MRRSHLNRVVFLILVCAPFSTARASDVPDWLTLSGSFRVRQEIVESQFRPELPADDHQTSLRTIVRARAERGRWEALVEVFDSRTAFEREGGLRSTGVVNALEPVQALVRARFGEPEEAHGAVSFGRFTVDLGSRRLVGRNNFRNTTNSFTGVLSEVTWPSGRQLTAFFALPQRRRPAQADAIERAVVQLDRESFDQRLWALHLDGVRAPMAVELAPYLIGLDESDGPDFATLDRHLITIGTRALRRPAGARIGIDTEVALQYGTRRADRSDETRRDLDVFAWMVHAGVRLQPQATPSWSFEGGLDAASGDRDPNDTDHTRFDNLFGPRRSDWGPTGIFGPLGPANIVSPYLRADWKGAGRWSQLVRHRVLWLAQARDAFASTGVVDDTGDAGRSAGQLSELRTRCWLVRDRARLELGTAVLWNGHFLREASGASGRGDSWYAHVDLEFWF